MSLFKCRIPLILASASPRRISMLRELGLEFTICPAADEAGPAPGEQARSYALRVAAEKAACVLNMQSGDSQMAVLAADTVVSVDSDIFGKPDDRKHALAMLKRLNGCAHEVITACCLLYPDQSSQEYVKDSFAVVSRVNFWDCPEALLLAYAQEDEPQDKAGAYAVQGMGAFLVRSLSGSWSNVVGLPVSELVEHMLAHNLITISPSTSPA